MVNLTIEDCLNMKARGIAVIISNGNVIGTIKEQIPTQTANPSGDEQTDKAITMPILRQKTIKVNIFKKKDYV